MYQEIVETSKMYMKGITAVEEEWLPTFASYKCSFSKPLATQEPFYDVETGKVKCYMESRYGELCFAVYRSLSASMLQGNSNLIPFYHLIFHRREPFSSL